MSSISVFLNYITVLFWVLIFPHLLTISIFIPVCVFIFKVLFYWICVITSFGKNEIPIGNVFSISCFSNLGSSFLFYVILLYFISGNSVFSHLPFLFISLCLSQAVITKPSISAEKALIFTLWFSFQLISSLIVLYTTKWQGNRRRRRGKLYWGY